MSAKLMKPTVNLKAKNPQMALYAHILALVAGIISLIFGIVGLLGGNVLSGLVSIIIAAIVVVVELDTIEIEPLKDALVRGIVWILFAVIGAGAGELSNLAIAIAGILYLVYHFN